MNVAQPPTSSRSLPSNREANLRRVAIVLSSLPPSVSASLIGNIDPESKQLLRRAMTNLSDVDPLERQRALTFFKGMVEQPQSSRFSANRIDEVSLNSSIASQNQSQVVKQNQQSSSSTFDENHSISNSPLAFLGDVQDDLLVKLLSDEHPQAAALVLASISPAQAARVIPRLAASVQSDALGRIGRLGDVPEEAVEELAQHLKTQVEQMARQQQRSSGQRALSAILAAMPIEKNSDEQQSETPRKTVRHNRDEPDQLDPLDRRSSDDVKEDTEVHSLRLALGTSRDSIAHTTDDLHDSRVADHDEPLTSSTTDATHQYLIQLPPRELCSALGLVETNQALLALCGLPKSVCDAAMKFLPRAQAKQVRSQMNSLASVQLHEIDEAKAVVASALMKQRQVQTAA